MHKNLSEMVVHIKGLWSEIVIPKNIFSLQFTVFNRFYCLMFDKFFQGTVFLCFTKLVLAIHALTDTVFISEQHLQPWLCIYIVFDRYFYSRRIVTSKEHMQPYIWVVPPLFQEATCRDQVFSRVLPFFEISTCNRLCFQRYEVNLPPVAATHSTNGSFSIIKEQLQSQAISNLLYFQKRSSCSKAIS